MASPPIQEDRSSSSHQPEAGPVRLQRTVENPNSTHPLSNRSLSASTDTRTDAGVGLPRAGTTARSRAGHGHRQPGARKRTSPNATTLRSLAPLRRCVHIEGHGQHSQGPVQARRKPVFSSTDVILSFPDHEGMSEEDIIKAQARSPRNFCGRRESGRWNHPRINSMIAHSCARP